MSRDFARSFYNSQAWKRCRAAYAKKEPLCEVCLKQGLISPVEIVHHIIELTPENITDPKIALGFDNLQSVCRDCHAKHHEKENAKRYKIGRNGEVVLKHTPSPPSPPLPPATH